MRHKRGTNDAVVACFLKGQRATSVNGTLSTDGTVLFSYMMQMAVKNGGTIRLLKKGPTPTTNGHLSRVKKEALNAGFKVLEVGSLF